MISLYFYNVSFNKENLFSCNNSAVSVGHMYDFSVALGLYYFESKVYDRPISRPNKIGAKI